MNELPLTVIVISYNNRDLTLACLAALEAERRTHPFHIIVVDNASSDASATAIASAFTQVQLLQAPTNLGFAGGNNLALRQVRTPWAVLVNNDAVVRPGFMAALAAAIQTAAPDVAALTARLLLAQRFRAATPGEDGITGPTGTWCTAPAGPVRLINSTGNLMRTDGYGTDRGWLLPADQHHPGREVFGFCGAGAALRMSAIRELRGFDESFFLYYEDSDLSWRARLAGYRTEYVADAIADHHHAASTGQDSALFRFYNERNRLLILVKNASWRRIWRQWGKYILTTGSLALRRRAPWTITSVRLRAFFSAVAHLPQALAARRRFDAHDRARVERLLVSAE